VAVLTGFNVADPLASVGADTSVHERPVVFCSAGSRSAERVEWIAERLSD